MERTHRNTAPPIKIPIQARGRPDSFRFRILFSEVTPKINAVPPSTRLTGKQANPVNGMGSSPVQNESAVNTPNTRLIMDCVFVVEETGCSRNSMKYSLKPPGKDWRKNKIKPSFRQDGSSCCCWVSTDSVGARGFASSPLRGNLRLHFSKQIQSGREDLNLRPLAPHASALAGLRHAPIERNGL